MTYFLNIKHIILIAAILTMMGMWMSAEAGNRQQNVYVDLFDSSNVVSVNYDSRFSNTSVFGWRIGVGYSRSGFNHPNRYAFFPDYRPGVSLPLGINALFGKHSSKFEVGVGITPSLAAFRESVTVRDEYSELIYDVGPTSWCGACAFGIDMGYRLQRDNGFMFRIGISPYLDVNETCVSMHGLSLVPYLGFGWTF